MPTIRPSCETDIPAIAALYADYVLHSTCTFEIDPPSPADMAARRAEVLGRGLPWLVLEEADEVLGYAYCNWFKPRPAYRYSAENSIYLAPAVQGRGLGRLLLAELAAQAEVVGVRKLIAVIGDSENAASVGLHRKLGFEPVGTIRSCGWKFDRWLDIVLMEKTLGDGDRSAPRAQSAPC